MPSGRSASSTSASVSAVPSTPFTFDVRTRMRGRVAGRGYSSTYSGDTRAPATSTNSSIARAAALATASGSMPRSKRALDSDRSFRRFDDCAIPIGSKYAASSRIRVVASDTSESPPPMIPASACGARSPSQIKQVRRVERAVDAVEGRDDLAVGREPDDDARARRGGRGRTRGAAGCARAARSW